MVLWYLYLRFEHSSYLNPLHPLEKKASNQFEIDAANKITKWRKEEEKRKKSIDILPQNSKY